MSDFFNLFLVRPMYNLMILIVETVPFADLGLAVIILTIIIRFVLFPLSKSALVTQVKMKKIQGPLKELQEKYKDNQQVLAMEMMSLYKKNNIKPFSGIFLMLLQIPVILALYSVFISAGLPGVNPDLLYSFVPAPDFINIKFLNLFDITQKNFWIAALVLITGHLQAKISFKNQNTTTPQQTGFGADLMKSLQIQMIYVFPIILGVLSYTLGGIVALYFLVGNIFTIFQQKYLQKKMQEHNELEVEKV